MATAKLNNVIRRKGGEIIRFTRARLKIFCCVFYAASRNLTIQQGGERAEVGKLLGRTPLVVGARPKHSPDSAGAGG